MKKSNKLFYAAVSVGFSMLLTACGNTAKASDKAEDAAEANTPSNSTNVKTEEGQPMGNGPRMGGIQRGGRKVRENAPEIQKILDAHADKFKQFVFEDAENGISLEYSLFIPQDYDSSTQYPLIMFIPDASGAGKSARQIVEQYYGATVWATAEEQQKHPAFVMVPAFTEIVVDDDWNVSPQIETAVHLISWLRSAYSIDSSRIYTTGQSMGCMTSLYLNSIYPDLFAASMYVAGQWDVSVLKTLENQKFFYIVAGGDAKASGGQKQVIAMFDADGVPYSYGMWSAQNSAEEQAAAVKQLLSLGYDANMICFETGSVLNEGTGGMEHMESFNHGYKLTAVRDWLFEQHK